MPSEDLYDIKFVDIIELIFKRTLHIVVEIIQQIWSHIALYLQYIRKIDDLIPAYQEMLTMHIVSTVFRVGIKCFYALYYFERM